jgi:hypothetical protein
MRRALNEKFKTAVLVEARCGNFCLSPSDVHAFPSPFSPSFSFPSPPPWLSLFLSRRLEVMFPVLKWLVLLCGMRTLVAQEFHEEREEIVVSTRGRVKLPTANAIPQNGECESFG